MQAEWKRMRLDRWSASCWGIRSVFFSFPDMVELFSLISRFIVATTSEVIFLISNNDWFCVGASERLPIWRHRVFWLWWKHTTTPLRDAPWRRMSQTDCWMCFLPRRVLFHSETGMASFRGYVLNCTSGKGDFKLETKNTRNQNNTSGPR